MMNKMIPLSTEKDVDIKALDPVSRVYAGKLLPDTQIDIFRNIDQMFPSRIIARGENESPLSYRQQQIVDFPIRANGQTYDLFDYISRNRVTGLLMLKKGEIAFEYYGHGNTPKTRWVSMSMAKSVSSALVGAAIHDRYIDNIEDGLTKYLPTLKGSAFDGVNIRQLLQMTSGVKWDETHTNPSSERRAVLDLQIAQKPGSILDYMAKLPRAADPGNCFNYSTGDTYLISVLLKAVTGKNISDYLSERIWSKIGTEMDASWWLEAPNGLEFAGAGIQASLRDYGRFGLFMANDGVVGDERILPKGWVTEMSTPQQLCGETVNYGYMWWVVPPEEPAKQAPGFSARAIFGQFIYVNPVEETVLVVWSARSKPMGAEVILDNDFFHAALNAL